MRKIVELDSRIFLTKASRKGRCNNYYMIYYLLVCCLLRHTYCSMSCDIMSLSIIHNELCQIYYYCPSLILSIDDSQSSSYRYILQFTCILLCPPKKIPKKEKSSKPLWTLTSLQFQFNPYLCACVVNSTSSLKSR